MGWDIICEIKDFFLQSGGDDATMELIFSWGLVVSSLLPPFLGLWTVGGRGGSWGRRLRRRWRDPFSDWRSELGTLAVQSIGGGGERSTSTLAPGGSYCEKDTESTGFSIVKRRGGGVHESSIFLLRTRTRVENPSHPHWVSTERGGQGMSVGLLKAFDLLPRREAGWEI